MGKEILRDHILKQAGVAQYQREKSLKHGKRQRPPRRRHPVGRCRQCHMAADLNKMPKWFIAFFVNDEGHVLDIAGEL